MFQNIVPSGVNFSVVKETYFSLLPNELLDLIDSCSDGDDFKFIRNGSVILDQSEFIYPEITVAKTGLNSRHFFRFIILNDEVYLHVCDGCLVYFLYLCRLHFFTPSSIMTEILWNLESVEMFHNGIIATVRRKKRNGFFFEKILWSMNSLCFQVFLYCLVYDKIRRLKFKYVKTGDSRLFKFNLKNIPNFPFRNAYLEPGSKASSDIKNKELFLENFPITADLMTSYHDDELCSPSYDFWHFCSPCVINSDGDACTIEHAFYCECEVCVLWVAGNLKQIINLPNVHLRTDENGSYEVLSSEYLECKMRTFRFELDRHHLPNSIFDVINLDKVGFLFEFWDDDVKEFEEELEFDIEI